MKTSSLRKIYLAFAMVTLTVALTIMGETQNSQIFFKLKSILGISFAENTPDSIVSLWGILILSVLLISAFGLITEHAKLERGSWRARFPFRILDLEPESNVGKWFAMAAVLLFVIVPFWALGHSWRVMHSEAVLCAVAESQPLVEIGRGGTQLWTIPDDAKIQALFFDGYRLAGEAGCQQGATTFFPLFQPLFFLLLAFWVLWQFYRATTAVLSSEPLHNTPKND